MRLTLKHLDIIRNWRVASVQPLAAAGLLLVPADLAFELVGLVLVDLLANILLHVVAFLNRLGLVHALVRLEVVALPEVLRPDLAAVAVVLPELLAHSNRLVDALLDQLGRPRALCSQLAVALVLELLDVLDLLRRPAAFVLRGGQGGGREEEDEGERLHPGTLR